MSLVFAIGCEFFKYQSQQIGLLSVAVALSTLLVGAFACVVISVVEFASATSIFTTIIVAMSCGLVNYSTGSKAGLAFSSTATLIGVFQIATYFDLLNGFAITSTITVIGLIMLTIAKSKSGFQTQNLISNSTLIEVSSSINAP